MAGGSLIFSDFRRLAASVVGSVTCQTVPFGLDNFASWKRLRSSRTLRHVVDVIADGREFETKETLAGSEKAQMQEKVDLGADRAAVLEGLALRSRQREEEITVAMPETRKTHSSSYSSGEGIGSRSPIC